MSALRAALESGLAALGVPGICGFGLLLFSLGLYESAIAPGAAQNEEMRAQLSALRGPAAGGQPQESARSLSGFRDFFPEQATLGTWLDRIYAIAEKEGLEVPRGEYRLVRGPDDPVSAYQAVFPIKGSYQQVRRFVATVLNEMPFVSLDDLRLEKQRSVDQVVDSQIRMTLYLRARQP